MRIPSRRPSSAARAPSLSNWTVGQFGSTRGGRSRPQQIISTAWRNEAKRPAVIRVVASPGAEAEYGLRMKFLMSRDGFIPTPGAGGPPKHLLLGAVLIDRGGLYFPPLPRWLFRALMATLAAVGRWRGRGAVPHGALPRVRPIPRGAGLEAEGRSALIARGAARATEPRARRLTAIARHARSIIARELRPWRGERAPSLPRKPGVLCSSCNARKGLSQRRR